MSTWENTDGVTTLTVASTVMLTRIQRRRTFANAMPGTLWIWPPFGTIAPTITPNGTLKRTTSTTFLQRLLVLPITSTVRWDAAELSQLGTRTTLKSDHAAKTRRPTPAHTKIAAPTEPSLPQVAVNRCQNSSNCEIFSPMSSSSFVEVLL